MPIGLVACGSSAHAHVRGHAHGEGADDCDPDHRAHHGGPPVRAARAAGATRKTIAAPGASPWICSNAPGVVLRETYVRRAGLFLDRASDAEALYPNLIGAGRSPRSRQAEDATTTPSAAGSDAPEPASAPPSGTEP